MDYDKCPCCGSDVNRQAYYMDAIFLEEEIIECDHCEYFYQFSYGYYQEVIDGKLFSWSYNTDDETLTALGHERAKAKRQLRAQLNPIKKAEA